MMAASSNTSKRNFKPGISCQGAVGSLLGPVPEPRPRISDLLSLPPDIRFMQIGGCYDPAGLNVNLIKLLDGPDLVTVKIFSIIEGFAFSPPLVSFWL